MNEYWKAFQDITQSVERLLTDEHKSLEIKESATSLRKSVQPCMEELKQSASRLKPLILVCSYDLYRAENVWLSKPRIAKAAKQEIWEQLGEISGRLFRIRLLANQCKSNAVRQAIKSWDKRIIFLKNRWFIDGKGQLKQGVGWGEKEGFIKQLFPIVDYQLDGINRIIKESLSLIYEEITIIQLELIQHYVSFLDNHDKANYTKQFDSLISEIEEKFSKPTELLPNHILKFKTAISSDLTDLNGWGDIYWVSVFRFKDKVSSKIEEFITAIFDDRVKIATQALEQAIAFYNDFLERQERYQQETPEQREAEKAWIDQQRWELEQVQHGIEAILDAS